MFEAAETLAGAGGTKGAALMVLVVTHRGGAPVFGQALPHGVIAVDSPAQQVREALDRKHQDGKAVLENRDVKRTGRAS